MVTDLFAISMISLSPPSSLTHTVAYMITYSRSHNSVNVVYCNYEDITSNYSEIIECNLLPSVGTCI